MSYGSVEFFNDIEIGWDDHNIFLLPLMGIFRKNEND